MARRIGLKKRTIHEEPLINLTPLIDVVFVILIMFIVVAPLLELDRVELAKGHHQTNENSIAVQEKSAIAIYVRQDNSVLFNKKEVTVSELTQLLQHAKEKYPKEKPQLFHDKKAFFGTYQSVKNAVEEAGFSQMDVILQPE